MSFWKIKLRTLLLIVFLSTIVVSSALIIFFTDARYSKSIHELSLTTIDLASYGLYEKIGCILQEVETLSPLGKQFYEHHPELDLKNTALIDFFLGVLAHDSNLFAYYLARPDGSYLIAINPFLAKFPIFPDIPKQTAYLILLSNGQNNFRQIRAYYNQDFTLISFQESLDDFDPRVRPWFVGAQKAKTLYWTDPYPYYYAKENIGFSAAEPFYDSSNNLLCIIGTDFSFNLLFQFLQEQMISENGHAFILDRNGKVLLPSPMEGFEKEVISNAFNTFLKSNQHNFSYKVRGETFLASLYRFPTSYDQQWYIVFLAPLSDFFAGILQTQHQAVLLSIFVLGLASLLVVILSLHISKPIVQLAKEIDRIARLDIESETRIPSHIAELSLINASVASMRIALRSFAHYVPKEIAKQLMRKEHEIALGGEMKTIAIFFTDIANFTSIAESLPIDKVNALLTEYFEIITKIILEYEGTIDKYIGDSIMSIWGAPQDLPDFADRSCTAALLCQKKLAEFHKKCQKKGVPEFTTRMGIETGPVIVGNFGTAERMNYSAIGDAVNTAARLQALNKTYRTHIIVGEKTIEAAGSQFLARPLEEVEIRGKKNKIKVFELLAKMGAEPEIRPKPDQIALCASFTEAFNAFDRGRLDEAIQLFQGIHQRYPHDYPTAHYLKKLTGTNFAS